MYSISQLANLLDLSTYTLRYYEREQIVKPDRNSQGNRVYSDLHLQWLQFVLKLKEAQMPIVQIKKYAQYVLEGEHTAEARLNLLQAHRAFIQQQIESLNATDHLLEAKIAGYKKKIEQKQSSACETNMKN
ncbi:MerR family transcriptional regulator [Paenibacillus sp. WQ 127069]|uniref:MerR family transcriptional regulator n=1 Tax=Paenibacillus baimaensis TaxID=2982185 RepID=A0ABT2UDX1_9BACL|nr:MerR family transcriptional regulator [Paenibacillus sp. WQ 127069]MCU6792830.1 MerR family transcriptional regulator [Paenibacillus sp. WQ 127069]